MTSPSCNDLDLQESHDSDVTDSDELYLSDESDDFLSEEDDEIAATKRKVDETVRRFVTGLKDFNELLSEIEHIVGSNELSQRDRSDIEKSYVDLCISCFHDKLIVWLRNDLSDSVKESLNDFLRSAQNVLDFERYFDSDVVPHCRLVVQCKKQGLMKPCDETPLIHKTVKQVWCRLYREIETSSPISDVRKYLTQCFVSGKHANIAVQDTALETVREIFTCINELPETSDAVRGLKQLVPLASHNLTGLDADLLQGMHDAVKSYHKKPEVDVTTQRGGGRTFTVLSVFGDYVDIGWVAEEVERRGLDSFDELRIFSSIVLLVNKSVTWPGRNVVLVSSEIHISKPDTVLETSGKHAQQLARAHPANVDMTEEQTKRATATKALDGKPGRHGMPGESAGNVLILCDDFVGSEMLSIQAHGGDGADGGNGESGQSGRSGRDGKEISKEDFEKRFPPVWLLDGFDRKLNKTINCSNVSEGESEHAGLCSFAQGRTNDGFDVTFSYSNNSFHLFLVAEAYVLVKGTAGTTGQAGGDGGKAGEGGDAGRPGDVEIEATSHAAVTANRGKPGKKGEPGKGGKGGRNGKRGGDRARIERGPFRRGFLFGKKKLETKYNVLEVKACENSDDSVYCWKKESYIKIHETPLPTRDVYQDKGNDDHNKKGQGIKHQSRRKEAISVHDIRAKYQQMTSRVQAQESTKFVLYFKAIGTK